MANNQLPPISFADKLGNFLVNAGKNIVEPIVNPVIDAYNKIPKVGSAGIGAKNPGDIIKNAIKNEGSFAKNTVGNKKFVGDAASLGAMGAISPEAGLLKGMAIPGAISGGANDIASGDNSLPGIIGNAAVGAVAAPIAGKVGKILSKPVEDATLPETKSADNALTNTGQRFLRGQYNAKPSTMQEFSPEHIKQLANWGVHSPKQVMKAADLVTGQNGVAPKIIKSAVAKANPVDITGLGQTAKDIMQKAYGIAPKDEQKFYQNTVRELANKVPNKSTITNGRISDVSTKDPLETYNFLQGLRKEASNLGSSSNEAMRNLAPAYRQFANAVDDKLYLSPKLDASGVNIGGAGANDILNNTPLSPEDLAPLNKEFPKIATNLQDVAQNGTVGDLKHLQWPLVTGNNAANESAGLAKGSPLTLRNAIAGYVMLHNPVVGVGMLASNTSVGERALGKLGIDAGNAVAGTSGKMKFLPSITGGVATSDLAAKAGPLAARAFVPPDNQEQNQNYGTPNKSHNGTVIAPPAPDVNHLPQTANDIQVGDDGNMNLLNPFKTGLAIPETGAENSYTTQKATLSKQLADYQKQEGPDTYNPKKLNTDRANAAAVQTQLDNLEAQHSVSQKISSGYDASKVIVSASKQALTDLSKSGSNLIESNGTINDTNFKINGPYSGLVGAVDNLQKEIDKYGSGLVIYAPGMTSDVLKSNIKQAEAIATYNRYYAQLGGSYTGGSTNIPPVNPGASMSTTTQLPPVTPPTQAPMQGGQEASYQFTAPNPGYGQLPAIQ